MKQVVFSKSEKWRLNVRPRLDDPTALVSMHICQRSPFKRKIN